MPEIPMNEHHPSDEEFAQEVWEDESPAPEPHLAGHEEDAVAAASDVADAANMVAESGLGNE